MGVSARLRVFPGQKAGRTCWLLWFNEEEVAEGTDRLFAGEVVSSDEPLFTVMMCLEEAQIRLDKYLMGQPGQTALF